MGVRGRLSTPSTHFLFTDLSPPPSTDDKQFSTRKILH